LALLVTVPQIRRDPDRAGQQGSEKQRRAERVYAQDAPSPVFRQPLEQQVHARMRAVERRDDQPAARREQHDGLDDLDRAEQREADLPADRRERVDRGGNEQRPSGDPDEQVPEPLHVTPTSTAEKTRADTSPPADPLRP